jgi:site-specific recombinase XerD
LVIFLPNKSLEGAYSPNTIRYYRSDFEYYATSCQKYQYNPLDIQEDKFSDYILKMGESLTVAKIQR